MFTGKKRKKFIADLNLINKKLEEKTPIYMRTNGITIFNKNVSVLFKITSQNGVVDDTLKLGNINSVAVKYHEMGTDEFVAWIISSAMQLGSLNN